MSFISGKGGGTKCINRSPNHCFCFGMEFLDDTEGDLSTNWWKYNALLVAAIDFSCKRF